MIGPEIELLGREIAIARHLSRLFRFERAGHLLRRSVGTARELLDRRQSLINELMKLEERRRSLAPWVPDELNLTMAVLAREVERGEQRCLEFLAEIGARLSRLRGEGTPTGLRDVSVGSSLGRG